MTQNISPQDAWAVQQEANRREAAQREQARLNAAKAQRDKK